VPDFTRDLWWFVRDVHGIERTITAVTEIFEQPREDVPVRPRGAADAHE
jgi:hypothetical protein